MALLLGFIGICLIILGTALLSVPAALVITGLIFLRAAQALLQPPVRSET